MDRIKRPNCYNWNTYLCCFNFVWVGNNNLKTIPRQMEKLALDLYSISEIGGIIHLTHDAVSYRIKILKIFPDAVIKGKKMFSKQKVDCIQSFNNFKRKENFLIFESKMNFETI